MEADSLVDSFNFVPSSKPIVEIVFSQHGDYFAAYDTDNHVILFQLLDNGCYEYIGRAKAHTAKVVGVVFGQKEKVQTLLSIGEDG